MTLIDLDGKMSNVEMGRSIFIHINYDMFKIQVD